jgi:hypothetical protein
MSPYTEHAFETVLTERLLDEGYEAIASDTFDREQAVFPHVALDFILLATSAIFDIAYLATGNVHLSDVA